MIYMTVVLKREYKKYIRTKYAQVIGKGRRKNFLVGYYFLSSRVKQAVVYFLFCVSFKHFQT